MFSMFARYSIALINLIVETAAHPNRKQGNQVLYAHLYLRYKVLTLQNVSSKKGYFDSFLGIMSAFVSLKMK